MPISTFSIHYNGFKRYAFFDRMLAVLSSYTLPPLKINHDGSDG
ncbi:MAG: hypothetical protein ACFFD4_04325 [Candidatus Odinarchaeota archaeon]